MKRWKDRKENKVSDVKNHLTGGKYAVQISTKKEEIVCHVYWFAAPVKILTISNQRGKHCG